MDDMMIHTNPNTIVENQTADISVGNRLEIIDECVRKKYLARLSEMEIAPVGDLPPLEEELINNVRLYRVTEMVYRKGEPVTDKFTTVFNTLATYNVQISAPEICLWN